MQELKEQIEHLHDNIHLVPKDSREFAVSLLTQYQKKGHLSYKQIFWVGELLAQAAGITSPAKRQRTEDVGDFSKVYKMLEDAKKHLQFPSLILSVAGHDIKLYISGSKSKVPNTLNLASALKSDDAWYGRVTREGQWSIPGKIEDLIMNDLAGVLIDLGLDPAETVKKQGKKCGRCCFCHLPLTDERSTAAGFGPTCADHFGLKAQWDSAVKELEKEAVAA